MSYASSIRQQPRVADGKRDLEKRRVLAEPIGAGAAMREIGPEFAGEIGAGDDAHVDLVAELCKDVRRCPADPISARFVDAWTDPDILLNAEGQSDQLLPFELERQIAGIGILVRHRLDQGWIIPGLQMGADFADPRVMQIADELVCLRCAAHWVVEDEGRPNVVSLEDPLRLGLAFDRSDTHCPPWSVRRPIKFSFGIDDDHENWRLFGRPVYRPPGMRVEHASAVAFDSLPHCGLEGSRL